MSELTPELSVELIGGPCCGMSVKWRTTAQTRTINHQGYDYHYRYEGNGKAVHFWPHQDKAAA